MDGMGEAFESEALDCDGEDDDEVGHGKEEVAFWVLGEGEDEGDGDTTPEAAPGEHADGTGFEWAEEAEEADGGGDGDETGGEDEGDGEEAGDEGGGSPLDNEEFEADKDEEDGVEHLIDEFPEDIEAFASGLRHGEGAPVVSDHETGDDHGERAGDVEGHGEAIAAGDDSKGDEDFDLVIVDTLDEVESDGTEGNAEGDASEGFDGELV